MNQLIESRSSICHHGELTPCPQYQTIKGGRKQHFLILRRPLVYTGPDELLRCAASLLLVYMVWYTVYGVVYMVWFTRADRKVLQQMMKINQNIISVML